MKLRILTPAIEDLACGREFYEHQGDGLGDYFFESLCAEIDSLLLFGGIHPLHFGFHRLIAKRFPYAVYYTATDEEMIVYRVLDCRRNPHWTKRELKK
jgi:hypothetical protein